MAERRARWKVEQLGLDSRRLVFVDETWSTTTMTRLRGRAPRSERFIDAVPHGHWKTSTLIAALDWQGMRCSMLLDGAINQIAFEKFVEAILVPTLNPGDLVILDNLSSHKSKRTADLIRAAQADLLFLPPYSPDFNPIENAFSKYKQLLRSAERRTIPELWFTTQPLLDQITPQDAAGFFRHAGYATERK